MGTLDKAPKDELKVIVDRPDEEYETPSYSTPGKILVELYNIVPDKQFPEYRKEYLLEIHDYDGCVFWIQEGVGIEYWINEHCDLEHPGFYVIEGIVGYYHKGTWGYDDDTEEWEFSGIRKATVGEMVHLYIDAPNPTPDDILNSPVYKED